VFLSNAKKIVSSKSLHSADQAFMDGRDLLKVKVLGKDILLKQPDFGLVRELYGRLIYFPSPTFIPPRGSKVIDLGANVGLFSLLCAKLGAEVVAVEAQEGLIPLAQEHFSINSVRDPVKLLHGIIGPSAGVFSDLDRCETASHWGKEPPTLLLDNIIQNFVKTPQEMIYLLKMDIEGSEFALFNTQPEWLNRIHRLSMEVHPEFGDVESLCETITRAGFQCTLIPSWNEKGVPKLNPGFLYAVKTGGL
jgi:FkbM family methyltransferase